MWQDLTHTYRQIDLQGVEIRILKFLEGGGGYLLFLSRINHDFVQFLITYEIVKKTFFNVLARFRYHSDCFVRSETCQLSSFNPVMAAEAEACLPYGCTE
jgi:hypothetical protein